MALLDRLKGDEEPGLNAHMFYAGLVRLADAQWTRSDLETEFSISPGGTDKTQLDTIINGYQAAADKGRYLNAVHAVFQLLERDTVTMTNAEITTWLSAAESAY